MFSLGIRALLDDLASTLGLERLILAYLDDLSSPHYFVDLAKNVKEDDPSAPGIVYGASKVLGERKVWEPGLQRGPGTYSTHTFLNELFQGDTSGFSVVFLKPASRLVDSRDVAAVPVAALNATKANGQRWWDSRHLEGGCPDHKILPDFVSPQPDINIADEASNELLRTFQGTDWYTLK
ncbi:hypothetical protein EHS25_004779 [Saitozyma podzolica]|uniref:Uncharacterized protein n=1 Tax=Saitozyma podzolica TaxID=1890683 RepID=A0A427Y2X0_9TREE|nr:hypothetical protein EHS25_004779 [Saitozyma podzolica]